MDMSLLYLSRRDVDALGITPKEAREAVLKTFADHAGGHSTSLPKSSIEIGPGHGFQAMPSASAAEGVATLKWVAMAPVPSGSALPGINALIAVSDYTTGLPLAVLDGAAITLIRTAAMSAAAATYLAPPNARTIGMVGCGLQAHAHLDAFLDLFPELREIVLLSRSRTSAESVAAAATGRGLNAEIVSDADDLLRRSDIVISMVPGAPGLRAFLDARKLPAHAFAAAVDIGRSWIPEALPAFDLLVTDSLSQSMAPYDVNSRPVEIVRFENDLVHLAAKPPTPAPAQRIMFCFRGFALADLALASLVLRKAKEAGIGAHLER